MRVLVWQWGRFGSGPRLAAALTEGVRGVPGAQAMLSLSEGAELLRSATPPRCDLPVRTYNGFFGFVPRAAGAVFSVPGLARRLRRLAPDVAVCAMPGPLDLMMVAALKLLRVPFVVLVHEVDHHPGDGLPFQFALQRLLCKHADALGALSAHVGERLKIAGLAGTPGRPLIHLNHPPVAFDVPPPRPWPKEGLRLLLFGRLREYKGLDLFAEALALLGPAPGLEVRIVGAGPECPAMDALRALPGVTVENRWVPEDEVGLLIGWADALILPYREASQSGVAAAALAGGRRLLATNVGGLAEQLSNEPLALLCEPTTPSLADGVRRLLNLPAGSLAAASGDPDDGWRAMALTLCQNIETLVLRRAPAGSRAAGGRAASLAASGDT